MSKRPLDLPAPCETAKLITKDMATTIALGGLFFGAGGGAGTNIATALLNNWPKGAVVPVIPFSEAIASGKTACCVAFFGAPPTGDNPTISVASAVKAFHVLQEQYGRPIDFLFPCESGAGNMSACLVTAAILNKAVVDGDGAGRSVPKLSNTTLANEAAVPATIAFDDTSYVNLYIADYNVMEPVIRGIGSQGPPVPSTLSIASWTVSGIALQKLLVPGTVSALLMAGSGFQQSTSVDQSLAAVNNAVPASVTVSVVFTGTLTSITNSTSDAFTFGEVIVSSEDKKLAIRYQNENILAWELYGDGTPSQTAPIVVAPDALCYLQNANGQPLSNVELQAAYDKGQRPVLTIVKVKRVDPATGQPYMLASWYPVLQAYGYYGKYF